MNEHVLSGGGPNGISSYEDWNTFAKSVQTSSYQTDHATLTGMAALRVESLEPTMRAIVAQKNSFTFWGSLKRTATTSTVEEWMTQTSRGGQIDGMFNSELGNINFESGEYNRQVLRIKYLMTGAAISHVASVQKLHGEQLRARENMNALTRIANAAERGCIYGDESIVPNAFNGYFKQVADFNGGSNLVDAEGLSDANEYAKLVFEHHAEVMQEGSFGTLTDIYTDSFWQNAIDSSLFPQYRIHLDTNPTNLMMGAPVGGIRTSDGDVKINRNIWMNNHRNTQPVYVKNKFKATDGAPGAPTIAPTGVGAGAAGGAKGWPTARAGVYYFAVAAINANGIEGVPSAIASATVVATGALALPITPNADGKGTGYAIYRSEQDPDTVPTLADLRLVTKIPAAINGGVTTYVDVNQHIPGTSSAMHMNKTPDSIQWLQLYPATQFPLFPNNAAVVPWAVLMYGALQLGIPQHHYAVINLQPPNATWKAFKA